MVIPGFGQSVEQMTGIKSALRAMMASLEEQRDQAIDFAARFIHDALTDAADPLRFAPDELRVTLSPSAPVGSGPAETVILRIKGARTLADALKLGLDLSTLKLANGDNVASVLGLDDAGLLSISTLDDTQLGYALSLALDVAVEISLEADGSSSAAFLSEELDGTLTPATDANPLVPLELHLLAGMEPTDISFAIDAGSLGRYGVVARDTGFALGRDADVVIGSGALAEQLQDIGARLALKIGTGGLSLEAEGGFSLGLDLAKAFGNELQAIEGFSEARLEGSFALPTQVPSGAAIGTSLAKIAPTISLEFVDIPANINLRSLLIPQLDDFRAFTLADLQAMAAQAANWLSGDGAQDLLKIDLPFIGRGLDDILPISQVFEAMVASLDAVTGSSFV